MSEDKSRAEILIDALNYIKTFRDSVFIVKLGGEVVIDEQVIESVAKDLIFLNMVGIKPVVVHGGGREISNAMKKFGKKPEFIDGLRKTDKETMDIVEMVLTGKINAQIVGYLTKLGGDAVGLSGKSGHLFKADKKDMEVDLGYVGQIREVNPEIVENQLEHGYIPVVSPIGVDEEGASMNINADTAAAELAASLKAKKLIFLTNVEGVLDEEKKLIKRLTVPTARKLLNTSVAEGGMKPKLKACIQAVNQGVERTHIIKAVTHAILEEILTKTGTGTMITKKKIKGE